MNLYKRMVTSWNSGSNLIRDQTQNTKYNLMLRVLKTLPQTSSYFHNKEENKEMPCDWRTL